jgi:hypothetical protein
VRNHWLFIKVGVKEKVTKSSVAGILSVNENVYPADFGISS